MTYSQFLLLLHEKEEVKFMRAPLKEPLQETQRLKFDNDALGIF